MTTSPGDFREGLRHAPNPVYVTDERNRVVAWNRAAEALLGHSAEAAVGRQCHTLIAGTDIHGNDLCDAECNVLKMARRNRVVRRFDMDARRASGDPVRVHCAILVVPGSSPSRFSIVHVLERAADEVAWWSSPGESSVAAATSRSGHGAGPGTRLTPREREVLGMLATGAGTRDIADRLFISPTTVRTHVRNLLQKMQAHSRLEAVMIGLRERLL